MSGGKLGASAGISPNFATHLEGIHAEYLLYATRMRQSREACRLHDDLPVPDDAAEAARHQATTEKLLKRMHADKAELESIEARLERLTRLSAASVQGMICTALDRAHPTQMSGINRHACNPSLNHSFLFSLQASLNGSRFHPRPLTGTTHEIDRTLPERIVIHFFHINGLLSRSTSSSSPPSPKRLQMTQPGTSIDHQILDSASSG